MDKLTKATHDVSALTHKVVKKIDLKDNLTLLGSSAKDAFTWGTSNDFDLDDEIIDHFKDKTSQAIHCMSYIKRHIHRLAADYWPGVFHRNKRIGQLFLQLTGPQEYEGVEEYYHEFDRRAALSETPLVHPKELESVNKSITDALIVYLSSLEGVKYDVETRWKTLDASTNKQIHEMNQHLRGILLLIKKRKVIQVRIGQAKHKLDKLEKQGNERVLLDKEKLASEKAGLELQTHKGDFENINHKLRAVLPQIFSLLDEFVDELTKLVVSVHVESLELAEKQVSVFSKDQGLHTDTYEDVESQWETSIVEPDKKLVDLRGEAPDVKPNPFKFSLKFKHKKFKAKQRNMFYDSADPLTEYIKYHDPLLFRTETYFPSKLVEPTPPSVPEKPAPQLPPRENSALNNAHLDLPVSPTSAPPPLPPRSKPLPLPPANQVTTDLPSTPIDTSDVESLESDSETSSVMSDLSLDSDVIRRSTPDLVDHRIKLMYNSSKNIIQKAPIPEKTSKYNIHLLDIETASSATYKLERFNRFFEHVVDKVVEIKAETKMVTAVHSFKSTQIGDLSFNKGDALEVLLDFQRVSSLYSNGKNWLVAATEAGRIGFIPSNYVVDVVEME